MLYSLAVQVSVAAFLIQLGEVALFYRQPVVDCPLMVASVEVLAADPGGELSAPVPFHPGLSWLDHIRAAVAVHHRPFSALYR